MAVHPKQSNMESPSDQIEELKLIAPSLSSAEEGGFLYLLIENLKLPENCNPQVVDVLLCPKPRDGYNSRLYFPVKITGIPERNWNSSIRVLNKTWHSVSWKTKDGLTLAQMLMIHLKALRS
jgi:hypothetical protein